MEDITLLNRLSSNFPVSILLYREFVAPKLSRVYYKLGNKEVICSFKLVHVPLELFGIPFSNQSKYPRESENISGEQLLKIKTGLLI
jgi:hypothetical protein